MNKPISKQANYSMISCRSKELILRTIELTKSSNENVALGACKVLLNKIIPDLKSQEITTEEGNKFIFEIIKDTTLESFNN